MYNHPKYLYYSMADNNNSDLHNWILSIVLSVIAFIVSDLLFGMYLEDNEAIVAAIHYGVMGALGDEQYFSNFHTFLFPFIYKLGQVFPRIPFYGIFKISFVLLIYTTLFKYVLGELDRYRLKSKINLFIALMLTFVIVSDNVFHLHCIRHSIILSFAAFLLNYQSVIQHGKTSVAAVVIFLIAVNTRSHSSAIMLGCFGAFLVLSGMPIKNIIRHYWVMAAIAAGFLVVYHVYGKYTTNMGKYIEAHYEYALIEKPSLYPLENMKTTKDTAKYIAVSQFFLSDSAELTISFIDRVANIKYEQKPIFTRDNFRVAINEIYRQSLPILPVLSFMLFAVLFWYDKKVRQTAALKTIAMVIAVQLVLFSLLLILVNDMKPRFYSALMSMLVFSVVMFHLPVILQKATKWVTIGFLLLIMSIGVWQWSYLSKTAAAAASKEKQIRLKMHQLSSITTHHPVLMFMGAEIPFSTDPLYRSSSDLYPKLASFDGGYLVYFSYGKERFEKLFGINPVNYPQLIDLLSHRNDILFYITPNRIPLIKNYFAVVYGIDMTFQAAKVDLDVSLLGGDFYSVKLLEI